MTSLRDYLTSLPPIGERPRPIGLVVQGGGMRGVYSMAALACLEHQGLGHVFDVVAGSSAGAINATYLLSGQADTAVRVYVDHLSTRKFVNPLRLGKVVDIDFLVDTLKAGAPIDVATLRQSPSALQIVVTDATTALPAVFTNRDGSADIYELIRATSALPALYNKKIAVNGTRYLDGGVADAIPVKRLVDGGCLDVVAVLTRQPGFRRNRQNALVRSVFRWLARGQSRAIKNTIGETDTVFNAAMELLEGTGTRPPGVRSWIVSPADPARLAHRTTLDRDKLEACARMGWSDMETALSDEIGLELEELC